MKLELLPLSEISLYIHIPSYSSYCNFYFLVDELYYYLSKLGFPKVKTLYILNGTLGILSEKDLKLLLKSFSGHIDFNSLDEFTFEANPEFITIDSLSILNDFNLNRLSLGIESFNETLLKVLGHRVSLDQIYASINNSMKYNFDLNLDLITGIPFQSKQDLKNDLEELVRFKPSHISLYDFVIEEQTPLFELFKNGTYKKDEEKAEELWLYSMEFLENKGYLNYEISNFALKEHESIHNSRYWELKPYLGIGPGSVSLLFFNENNKIKALIKKENELLNYKNSPSSFEVMGDFEFFMDHFFMGLGTLKGVSLSNLRSRFKFNEDDFSKFKKELLKQNGAFVFSKDFIYLKEQERFKLDFYLSKILDYFERNPFNPELRLP